MGGIVGWIAPMVSNADVYLAIAEEALETSKQHYEAARRPRPDGQPGYVITHDPDRTSFKQSLIAIAFAGIYLDALLYIVGVERLGKGSYKKIDRRKYEEKLEALGVADPETLKACKAFREARNDLMHEKAIDPQKIGKPTFRAAQGEAEAGVAFVRGITELLKPAAEGASG